MEVLLFSVSFCSPNSMINSFLHVQFSRLLSRGKDDISSLVFLLGFNTPQAELFLLIFFQYFDKSFVQFNFK